MPEYNSTIANWKSDASTGPELDPHSSPLTLYKGPEHIVKGSPEEMHEAFRHLEDGRMYFAVDTKKIYLDCDFTTSDGNRIQDRLSFGGNNGIYYGNKSFPEETDEFWFIYENGDLESAPEGVPQINDLILNKDGCFYRVTNVRIGQIDVKTVDDQGNIITQPSEEFYTIIETKKLTIAGSGSGGGSGGNVSSSITVSKSADSPNTFIKANNSIPIILRVTDSDPAVARVDVEIYINSQYVGAKVMNVSNEYQSLELKQFASYFVTNSSTNQVRLVFRDEHDATSTLTVRNLNLVELAIRLENANLGQKTVSSFPIKFYPYGGTSMYSWKVKVSLKPPGQGNAIIREMTTTADKGAEETFNVSGLDAYGEGQYTVDFWIEAFPEPDSEMLTSPVVTASFWYSSESSTAAGVTMSLQDSDNLAQYGTATILYTVVYAGASKSTVHLIARCNGTDVVNTFSTVNNGINQTWLVPLDLAGTYEFIIGLDDFNYQNSISDVEVSAPDIQVPVIDKENNALQLCLSATGKSNNQVDRDEWTWKNITSTFEHFNWSTDGWLTDENNVTSLHLSNGAKLTVNFAPFAMANTNNQGAQATGKTLEFDFKLSNVRDVNQILINIASWDSSNEGRIYCGIVGQGDKISINTTDLTNYRTPEEDMELSDDEKAKTNGLRAYLAEDERIHVAFVVQSANEEQNKSLIYTYINGVLSGLADYKGSLIDNDRNNPAYMVFDSTYGDIDIYNLRVYSKKFTDDEILYNYAADRPTVEERLAVRQNNAALDNNNEISLTEVMALGNIPYVVWTDCRKTKDKKGGYNKKDSSTWGTLITDQTPSLPTGKKDFRWCEFYYVDPQHPDRNIGDINHKVTGVIYAQGTSSLDYPVKNIRLRIRETDGNGNKQGKYSLLPAIPIEGLDSNNPQTKADAEAEQAKWENAPGVRLFTFKADYMDSSLAHNTGTGNVLAALYDSVGLQTPAQRYFDGQTISSNVVGRPCLGFYQAYNTTTPVFVGRYNFNTDKAEHELFGFIETIPEDDEGVQDLENTFGVATQKVDGVTQLKWGFHGTLDEKYEGTPAAEDGEDPKPRKKYYNSPSLSDEWLPNATDEEREAAFKLRIGYKDANGKTIDGTGPALYEYQQGPSTIQCWEFLNNANALCGFRQAYIEGTSAVSDWTGAFESRYPEYYTQPATDKRGYARLINWLNSTNQLDATDDPLDSEETYDGVTYTTDSKARRLAKFKAEIRNYMDLDMTIFYYVVTEAFLMIDSRAKNMMMCSFDCDMDAGTGHWFPIFYDMDTILGVDNKGILRFAYDTDDETDARAYNAAANYGRYENGEWVVNGRASVLWANLREAFQVDISSMYNALRDAGKFTYKFLSKSYNDSEADAFAPIYDNKDAKYKYIDPYGSKVIIDGVESEVNANYLHAAQGTRTLHREFFLNHRFALLDSKYPEVANGDYLSDRADIVLRLYDTSTGTNRHPTISTAHEHYGRFQLTSQSTQYGVYKAGNGVSLPPVKLTPGVPEWTPSLPANYSVNDQETYLFSLGDIYDLGDLSDKYPSTFDVRSKTKLRSLKFGMLDENYVSSTVLNISGWQNLPLLELLNIRKKKLQANPNLVNCTYFQTLLAAGSDITTVDLPIGGNLKQLELPATIQQLIIRDHRFFDTFHDLDQQGTKALTCEGYSRLVDLWIEGCPLVDTATLVKQIKEARTTEQQPTGAAITHVRLPDISWDIAPTAEWCTIENDVITDIPIVEFLSRASYGWDAEGNLTNGNTYIAGTIRIHNGTDEDTNSLGVDIYRLNKNYNKLFPELRFVYDDNSKNVTGYYINIHDINGGKVVERNGYKNSVVLGADEIMGTGDEHFNFRTYLNSNVELPVQPADGQYTYEFKGWSFTAPCADENVNVVNQALDIEVEVSNGMMAANLVSDYITLGNFDSELQFDLYPVFQKHLRVFNVWFYMKEEGSAENILNPECHPIVNGVAQPVEVEFGHAATPPSNEPTLIELDPNDKSQATIRMMDHYDDHNGQLPMNRITANVSYYPVFKTAVRMNEVVDPPTSYFSTSVISQGTSYGNSALALTTTEESVEATIKSSFTGEAIVVPLTIGGKKVITVNNASSTVKRIFFEKDNEGSSNILYFKGGTNAGFSVQSSNDMGKGGDNEILEFIDFGACKRLKVVGGGDDGVSITGEFCCCVNMYVPELPDSLIWIGGSAFRSIPGMCITKLPKNLVYIGQYAFRNCTGLTTVDASEHSPEIAYTNTEIGNQAFARCSNLTFGDVYYFNNWKIIGQQAFEDCTSLKAFNAESSPANVRLTTVYMRAFKNCSSLGIDALPSTLSYIDKQAFELSTTSNIGSKVTIKLSEIGRSITYIGEKAFNGCKVQNDNNGISWRIKSTLAPGETYIVHENAFGGLTCANLRFADWENNAAWYVDYDPNASPVWSFDTENDASGNGVNGSPWRDANGDVLAPFGMTNANGDPTPYEIQANQG